VPSRGSGHLDRPAAHAAWHLSCCGQDDRRQEDRLDHQAHQPLTLAAAGGLLLPLMIPAARTGDAPKAPQPASDAGLEAPSAGRGYDGRPDIPF
jgi:hypothetical protein